MKLFHNLEIGYRSHPNWYLTAASNDREFVFMNANGRTERRFFVQGWTLEDAISFNRFLCRDTLYAYKEEGEAP